MKAGHGFFAVATVVTGILNIQTGWSEVKGNVASFDPTGRVIGTDCKLTGCSRVTHS